MQPEDGQDRIGDKRNDGKVERNILQKGCENGGQLGGSQDAGDRSAESLTNEKHISLPHFDPKSALESKGVPIRKDSTFAQPSEGKAKGFRP